MKKIWPTTKAKLPEDEKLVGGAAGPKMFNDRTKEVEKIFNGKKEAEKWNEVARIVSKWIKIILKWF